jgi:vacuolar iron transporter family protein
VAEVPTVEAEEVAGIFRSYGVPEDQVGPVVAALRQRPDAWVDFMMRFELGLEAPDPRRALRSGGAIAGAYIAGGLVPLVPYVAVADARRALEISVVVTLLALLIFGYIKGHFTGARPLRSALQTGLIGGLAAAAAFAIARAIA